MITCKNNLGAIVSLPKEKFRFRPSVYGIIRKDDKICVCRNKSNGKLWFPGGGVERGEKLHDALSREIREETGLAAVKIGELLGAFENFFYYQPTDEAMHALVFVYNCSTDETQLLPNELVNDAEARDFQWIDIRQINEDDLGDLNKELYQILRSL